MKAQFKYALRQELPLRAVAFAAVVLLNLVFGSLGYFHFLSRSAMITAVTLSSLALVGIFTVNITADIGTLKSVFGTPDGYLLALTPVKSWRILLARTVSIICEDFISLFAGIFGVVWQSFVLSEWIGFGVDYSSYETGPITDIIAGAGIILLGYTYLVMLIVFGFSLRNSILFGIPGRSLLSVLGVLVVAWVFNLFNFVLLPFGTVNHWNFIYNIDIPYGFNIGAFAYTLITLVRIAALFIASSVLIERKNNL